MKNAINHDEGFIWEWYNNIDNTGWEYITPSDMDAVIAHGLQPQPRFRRITVLYDSSYTQEEISKYGLNNKPPSRFKAGITN